MASSTENYRAAAREDAAEMINHFEDEVVEQLLDDGEASDDFNNDYPDGDAYCHENHVDTDYSLTEAAELLDQLREYEETDSGLWERLEPRRAIAAQAAYTYGTAVYCLARDLIKEINDAYSDNDDPEFVARANLGLPTNTSLESWDAEQCGRFLAEHRVEGPAGADPDPAALRQAVRETIEYDKELRTAIDVEKTGLLRELVQRCVEDWR